MLISLQTSTAEDAQSHRLCWAIHPADLFTPVRAFRSLRAAGHHACLLESVEGPARLARWSFVGVNPGAHFRGGPEGCTLTTPEGTENLIGPSHEALREVARRYATAPVTQPGLPPFTGGWIGCFTYEWAASLEPTVPLPEDDPHGVGEAIFDHYSDLLAFDHASQRLILLAGCPRGADDYSAACERLERLAADLSADAGGSQGFRLLEDEPRAQTTRPAFEAGVERLQHEIGQGEIFQAVLSQRFEQRYEGDPFMLYRMLRLVNSAPHMFFFQADGLTLVGSSPERLASLNGRLAQVVPIAGTRPRDPDPDRDEALAAELLADTKERAEHDMLVDLARNDLGRVARVGTVAVKEYGVLEKFPTVQHLVSRVEAELASGRDALDLLAATFPAGTVSGAPKVRAMQLLAEIEGSRRGPYAGAFGYLDGAGNLDMAIAIRTLFLQGDTIHVQAGAGVVYDSVPEREYEETLHKSKALFEAIRKAASPAFQPEPAASTEGFTEQDQSKPGVRP